MPEEKKTRTKTLGTEKAKITTAKPSDPIIICWDAKPDDIEAQKLVLPQGSGADDIASFASKLQQLVSAAGELEPQRFATSFHPADFGIIDSIEQILVPQLNLMNKELIAIRHVELELYKLNIYSGPSGVFQKNVDTPRSESQIGSLVVCLPSQFEGGNLIVRRDENEVDFDWQRKSAEAIQWGAFYSDCEHEIKPITQGERITLTYNFMPGFMKQGGTLGISCSHSYPYTAKNVSELLPDGLKGADFQHYAGLHSFGLEVEVLPVIVDDESDDYKGSDDGASDESPDIDEYYYQYEQIGKHVFVGSHLWSEVGADSFDFVYDPIGKKPH
ncbi:uncharacterized protein N7483_003784 [Penicillium malachiteum]|uniref:uncharacterized protein n=1 Tax=Penicillium malachiteum TaxID=1324776 RepID=UPI002549A576|nr:uncharacterized protein N7483_003784 [Penicillium malachiteum]KAJ5729276.1 hypothetical protein N7483_003784 [Penicillium malachiteum]